MNPFEGLKAEAKQLSEHYHEEFTIKTVMNAIKAAATSGKYEVSIHSKNVRDHGIHEKLEAEGFQIHFVASERVLISWEEKSTTLQSGAKK